MLKLRRARVLEVGSPANAEQPLRIELLDVGGRAAQARDAIAQIALVGCTQVGDEVIVNTQARDLGLGSGGFDIVHVNLTRGLCGDGPPGEHVMKLNYTSLQHAVAPVEAPFGAAVVAGPAGVIGLHGQLAAVAWAFARAVPGGRLGYVQTVGGALPGDHSHVVRHLRTCGLLAGHITAGAAFGGEGEAITVIGALHHGLGELEWDAAVCGPGPGIVGSNSALGHGGMAALDSAHAALALGCPTVVVVRMSATDPRSRHRGISHHSLTVLDLLLAPVIVALAPGMRGASAAPATPPATRAGHNGHNGHTPRVLDRGGGDAAAGASSDLPDGARAAARQDGARHVLGVARPERLSRHDWRARAIDLSGYAASGLPAETMGRPLATDPLFFAAALAAGGALGDLVIAQRDRAAHGSDRVVTGQIAGVRT